MSAAGPMEVEPASQSGQGSASARELGVQCLQPRHMHGHDHVRELDVRAGGPLEGVTLCHGFVVLLLDPLVLAATRNSSLLVGHPPGEVRIANWE